MSDEAGILFPVGRSGRRSTMEANRGVWADAVRAVDGDLADAIANAANWREEYVDHVRAVTELGARSTETAQRIAQDGLTAARSRLVFRRDGEDHALEAAAALTPAHRLVTETINGIEAPVTELEVPYLGQRLRGDALRRRIECWVDEGIIEPSAGDALRTVMEHPDWLRLEGRRIALLGAGAETSPLEVLLSWGADVVALDLPRTTLWKRLLALGLGGAGRLHVPVRDNSAGVASRAGANLITELPEAAHWLRGVAEDRRLAVGFYVYADGALHVQATAAADALLTAMREGDDEVAIAYAGTPSDCYLVPPEVVVDSGERRRHRGLRLLFEQPVRTLSGGRLYADAYPDVLRGEDGTEWGVADALVKRQGPNYALAKRLQRWRAIASWAASEPASFNVGPPAWTRSVTKNRLLAAGYYGARYVGMEVFSPDTMRTVMTALLVHDLHSARPASSEHPERLVARNAVHGGYWRRPYDIRSTLAYTAVLGLPEAYIPTVHFR
jgi:hypothetical protein